MGECVVVVACAKHKHKKLHGIKKAKERMCVVCMCAHTDR